MNKYRLLPSIMCVDWLNVKKDLDLISSKVEYFHWDIVDGNFAPDFTMGTSIIEAIRSNYINKGDYHLMVDEPSRLFSHLGFREGDRVTIHVECSKNLHRDVQRLRKLGLSPGVALSPATPLSSIEYITAEVDRVLILAVNPGYHSQPMIASAITKLRKLREFLSDLRALDVDICIDGNVNLETITEMYESGAREFVLGRSGLFGGDILNRFNGIVKILDDLVHD